MSGLLPENYQINIWGFGIYPEPSYFYRNYSSSKITMKHGTYTIQKLGGLRPGHMLCAMLGGSVVPDYL